MATAPDADPPIIDADTRRRIEAFARAIGATPAEVVRQALAEFETAHLVELPAATATAYDLLDRAGLIGCLKAVPGSPTDLSTNSDHMKGFGGG